MKNTVSINYAKVFDTQKTLNSLSTIFNNFDFYRHFENMELYLSDINLNHDNCVIYKDSLDSIFRDLDAIRTKINELYNSLKKSSITFIDREELSAGKLDKLLKMYPGSSLTAELVEASNSTVTTIPEAQPAVQEEHEINTVPIGIAIGATGILGSIGAVVVDSLYGPKTKTVKRKPEEQFEEYYSNSNDDYYSYSGENQYDSDNMLDEYNAPSYTANRETRDSDQFYGSDHHNRLDSNDSNVEMTESKMKDVEPSKEIDLALEDEDDDKDLEDFY